MKTYPTDRASFSTRREGSFAAWTRWLTLAAVPIAVACGDGPTSAEIQLVDFRRFARFTSQGDAIVYYRNDEDSWRSCQRFAGCALSYRARHLGFYRSTGKATGALQVRGETTEVMHYAAQR